MLQFPLGDGKVCAIIEPGNIQRLKEGKPLKIAGSLVCYTPDMDAFLAILGVPVEIPAKGEPRKAVGGLHLTPEQIQNALDAVQTNDEVLR